jgi:hypothetical protein
MLYLLTLLTFTFGNPSKGNWVFPKPIRYDNPQLTSYRDSLDVRLLGRALFSSSFCTAFNGTRVYAGGGCALLIFDVSDPSDPQLLGYHYTYSIVWNLFTKGDTVYIANGEAGLRILDCSDPESPQEIGYFDNSQDIYAYGVYVKNDTAYIADGSGRLFIVNCENPQVPVLVGIFEFEDCMLSDVFVMGSIAYVGVVEDLLTGYLAIMDISDPTNPDTISTCNPGLWFNPRAVYVTPDSIVYVAGGLKDLVVFDAKRPDSVFVVGNYNSNNYSIDVWVSDGYIYLADGYAAAPNFHIFDTSQIQSNMTPVGSYQTVDIAWGVSVNNSIAYVADEWAGLQIIDCSDPQNPQFVGSYDIGGYARNIQLSGNLCYVACGGGNLRVVDCSIPDSAQEVGYFDALGLTADVWVRNDTAFIAEGYDEVQGPRGVEIVDFTDINNPSLIGSYTFPEASPHVWFEQHIVVLGPRGYVTDGRLGFWIMDFSDPENPDTFSNFDIDPDDQVKACDIFVVDTLVYVAYSDSGLYVVNVSNPYSPYEITHYVTPSPALAVFVQDDKAYVACGDSGLYIFDVSNPQVPVELGRYDTPGKAQAVYVSGYLVYVADGESGLRIINSFNPINPVEVGYYNTADRASDVVARGDTIYVADLTGGLYILEFYGSAIEENQGRLSSLKLLQSYPNPFKSFTNIRYSVLKPGFVEIAVYNSSGRLVERLFEGYRESGIYTVRWDGRDLRGYRLTNGVYFLHMKMEGCNSVIPILYLK